MTTEFVGDDSLERWRGVVTAQLDELRRNQTALWESMNRHTEAINSLASCVNGLKTSLDGFQARVILRVLMLLGASIVGAATLVSGLLAAWSR